MKAFRIILALVVAGATFYNLNVLGMEYGYPDRLDFRNRHYAKSHCHDEYHERREHSHHSRKALDTLSMKINGSTQNK